jgi:hypothetical protein
MEDLSFVKSPFALTASPDTAACWAGRPEVLERLKRLQTSYERRCDSTLDLMWANLGAGKSHVLYHLSHRLSGAGGPSILPVVIELPEQIRNFHDIYRRIVAEVPEKPLAEALATLDEGLGTTDLRQAGRVLLYGGAQERDIAREWLIGGRPHLSHLRTCTGITRRIEDAVESTDALCGILRAFSARRTRLVLMIDEFQRLSVLRPVARDGLLSSLRSIFSRTPELFSVIVAAAFRVERNALDCLSPELKALLGPRPSLSLPEMSETEALDFVRERFRFFRPQSFTGHSFAPFSEEAVAAVIDLLRCKSRPLVPREILQALAYCYDESIDINTVVGPEECKIILGRLRWEEE